MRLRAPHRRTLRGRVSLVAATVIAGWLIVLAAVFDLVVVQRLDTQIDDALRVRAQAASATVIVRDGRVRGVRDSATDGQLDSSIWVYDRTTALEEPQVDAARRRAADALAAGAEGYHDAADERFYVLPVRVHGTRIGSVIAGLDREPYDHTRDIVLVGSVVLVGLLVLGAYPILTRATGRALQPVARMTQQAADWSANAPAERFGHDQHWVELHSLARTLDELLDRVSAVLRHERQLSAELSHELRTPLARIAAEVELLTAAARPDQLPTLTVIRDDCTSMDSIIDTVLAAARTELAPVVGRCRLDTLLADLARHDPRIEVRSPPLTAGVDGQLVARMLGPVLDNSARFARTWIGLEATRTPAGVVVEISNDGPRLDVDPAEKVFEPGFSTGGPQSHSGAGLGLPLARRLARAADGELEVVPDAARTTFRLTLPAG